MKICMRRSVAARSTAKAPTGYGSLLASLSIMAFLSCPLDFTRCSLLKRRDRDPTWKGNRLSRRCSIPTARSDNVALHRIAGSDATSDVNEEEDAAI